MVRTIISISEEDKKWLDNYSHHNRQSSAETIRSAIKYLRERADHDLTDTIIKETAGIWKTRGVDGLQYVTELREDWE